MEFDQVIRQRRMVRAFTSDPIEPAVVDRLLRAGNRAPSAGFSQGYAFLVLEGDDLERFWALDQEDPPDDDVAAMIAGIRRAPVVVIPLSCKQAYLERYARPDKGWTDEAESHWPVPYWDIDTGFAALLIMLAAVDEGLGTLFSGIGIGNGAIDRFRSAFGVPDEYQPIGALAIGHRDVEQDRYPGSAATLRRKSLDDVVHRGRW